MAAALAPALGSAIGATTAGTAVAAAGASFVGPVTAAMSAAGTGSLLSTGLGVLSAGMDVFGGMQQGSAYKAQARQQELSARAEELKGKQQALQIRDNLRRTIAAQNAAFAARGISPQTGTPVVLGRESREAAMNDIDLARFNGDIAAMQGRAQAQQTRSAGRTSMRGGFISAIEKGSLL